MTNSQNIITHNHRLAQWLATGIVVLLPNIWLFTSQNTAILRGVIVITLAIFMPLFLTQTRQFPKNKLFRSLLLTFLLGALLAALTSNSLGMALFGFPTLPIGSITFIAALWVGWSVTKLIPRQEIVTLLIISGILSLLLAVIINLVPGQIAHSFRLIGFHEHSLAWAIQLSIACLFALWRFVTLQKSSATYGAAAFFLLLGIGLSGSRMALLACLLGVVSIFYLYRSTRWPVSKLIASLIVLLAICIPTLVMPRLNNANYAVESTQYRIDLFTAGARIIQDHPLGIGYGNIGRYTYSTDLPSQLIEPYHRQILIESSHNLWIDVAIGFGIIPGFIFLAICMYILYIGWHRHAPDEKIYAICLAMLYINFITTPASITNLVLLGLLAGFNLVQQKSNA